MKSLLYICFAVILMTTTSQAQIRHVRGIKSIDVMYNKTKPGQAYSLGYVSYLNNSSYIKGAAFYETGTESAISYTSMGAEAYYARNIVHAGFVYYLNAIGGAHLSVDNPEGGALTKDLKIPSAFKYGVLFGVENELFINDKFVLIVNFSQRMLVGSEFGNYRFFAGAGIRYNF